MSETPNTQVRDVENTNEFDYTLPVWGIDKDESVADRLTENARESIGPSRYFQSGEDWSDVFARVARNIAIADAVHYDTTVTHALDQLKDWVSADDFAGDTVTLTEETAPLFEYDAVRESLSESEADDLSQTAASFETAMSELRWMPNTPTLINAGTELQQNSACFVVEPGDSLIDTPDGGRASIMDAAKEAAEIMQTGGGVGYPFHLLRPKGARISSTGGRSSGPISFMQTFDAVCGTIKQGGCVATSERVMTDDGYVPMGDVYDGPPLGVSNNDTMVRSRDGLDMISESSDSGPMPTVTVQTQSGYEITVTPNHPILTVQDGELSFTPAGELDDADTVVLSQANDCVDRRAQLDSLENPTDNGRTSVPDALPDVVTDDLAKFLGILWGDGCVTQDHQKRVVFTLGNDGNGDSTAIEFVTSFLDDVGLTYSVTDRSGSEKGNYTRIQVGSAAFVNWLDKNGLVKDSDDLSNIPEALYRSPAAIPSFLGGMTVDAAYVESSATVRYGTVDEGFAQVLQDLLLLCGIPSKRRVDDRVEDKFGDKPMHTVTVFPGTASSTYNETIPHLLDGEFGTTSGERQNSVVDTEIYQRVLDDNYEPRCKLPDEANAGAVKSLRRYARGDRCASLERARSMFEDGGIDTEMYDVLDADNLFEPVEDVVESGMQTVCDIENKTGEPEFIASNFVVHNVRRGAQMGVMHAEHPDVGRFCVAKRGESSFTNFNISVGITDDFMHAVKNDEQYTLFDPSDGWPEPEAFDAVPQSAHFYSPEYEDAWNDLQMKPGEDENGNPVEENFWRDYQDEMAEPEVFDAFRDRIDITVGEPLTVPARFIWNLIVDGAYNNGEPGFVYLDEINREHSFDTVEHPEHRIHATNPCVAEGTLVNTPYGPRAVENIEVGDIISTVLGTETVDDVLEFENETVFEVTFSDGGSVLATEDHRFHVLDGKTVDDTVPLLELSEGDTVRLESSSYDIFEGDKADYEHQFRRGVLVGDGGYSQATVETNNRLSISFDSREQEYIDSVRTLFSDAYYDIGEEDHASDGNAMKLWLADAKGVLDEHNLDPAQSHEKDVDPTDIETKLGAQGFLDGLLAADGNINLSTNRPQIRWTTASEDLAQSVRTIALNAGMHARIYEDDRDSRGGTRADGSEIETPRSVYNIHIAGSSADLYAEQSRVGEYHPQLGSDMKSLVTDYMTTGGLWKADVESIEKTDQAETVYDLYCSDSDTWITEGYVNRGCAEQPLENYEPCNLGHVNLSLMMDSDAQTYDEWMVENLPEFDEFQKQNTARMYVEDAIDLGLLRETVETGTKFLDNVVTMSDFPTQDIQDTASGMRKIGVGVMGLHHMLLQMGVKYGSDTSTDIAREVMDLVDDYATQESRDLATTRGAFPEWEDSKWSSPETHPDWFAKHAHISPNSANASDPVRNHNVTTIAPTGTTSMIGNTTGGCEPLYNVAYYKNVSDDVQGGEMLVEVDDYFMDVLEANDVDATAVREEIGTKMESGEFDGIDSLDTVPDAIGELFVTTEDLTVEDHIDIQGEMQQSVDSSISKTLNMNADTDIEDVGSAIERALDYGIKGATIYRVGSRQTEVKTTNNSGGGQTLVNASIEELEEALEDKKNDE